MTQPTTTGRRARLSAKLALLSIGLATAGVLATSGVSEAHTPAVEHDCTHLHVSFSQYPGPATNNVLTVTIDNVVVTNTTFESSFEADYPWAHDVAHSWAVDLKVLNDPGYNFSRSGTDGPCIDSSTSTTSPSSSTTPSSTTTTAPGGSTTTTLPGTSTTTTSPATSTTAGSTTTSVASGGPVGSTTTTAATTSTVRAVTTTTAVAVLPPSGAGSSGGSPSGSLPVTGTDTGAQLTLALAVLLAGAGLVTVTRRRTRAATEES